MKKLAEFQQKLKAPKGQFNKFGKYKYRSCEDIIEAIKPIINPEGYYLIIDDSIELIGDRFYIKAVATITNGEDTFTASAYAREAETKKGMDESQITGAASSYARKYALNALLAIDDTKDADATNNHNDKATDEQRSQIEYLLNDALIDEDKRRSIEKNFQNYDHATAEKAINYLKDHQDKDHIASGKNYNMGDIDKKMDEVMADEKK